MAYDQRRQEEAQPYRQSVPREAGPTRAAYAAGQEEARSHYHELPQSPRYIYTASPSGNGGRNGGGTGGPSFEKIHLPILLVVSALLFTTAATYFGTSQFNDVKTAISNLGQKMDQVTDGMTQRITRIEEDIKTRTASRYSRIDHELWCLRTERINDGWRCGEIGVKNANAAPAIWSGQKDQARVWSNQMQNAIK